MPTTLKKETLIVAGIKVLYIFATFAIHTLVAKIFTQTDYALYSKFIMYSGYITIVITFGFTSSLIYVSKTESELLQVVTALLLIYLLFGSFGSLFFFGVNQYILLYAIILSSFNVALALYQFQLNLIHQPAWQCLHVLVIAFTVYVFSDTLKLESLMLSYFIVPIFFLSVFVLKYRSLYSFDGTILQSFKENLKYGTKTLPLMVLGQAVYIADFILIDFLLGDEKLSIYFVALIFVRLVFSIVDSVGNVIFPRFVKSFKDGEPENQKSLWSVMKIMILTTLFGCLVFYIIGQHIIDTLFGEGYRSAYQLAITLLLGVPGMIIYKVISRVEAARANWLPIYLSIGLSCLVNVILSFYLINVMGLKGAAYSSLFAYWSSGFLILIFRKQIKAQPL